jgi:hypothetical protein
MVAGAKPKIIADRLPNERTIQRDPRQAGGSLTALETPASLSPRGALMWEVIAPPLLEAKVLREDDVPMLIECAETFAASVYFRDRMWALVEKQERLDNEGLDGLEPDELTAKLREIDMIDQQVKRARAAWLQALTAAQRLSDGLGLGPVARVRLGLAKVQGLSLVEELQRMSEKAGGSDAGQS